MLAGVELQDKDKVWLIRSIVGSTGSAAMMDVWAKSDEGMVQSM
jgi:hypothetical protein